jgi:hypothetical protein
VNKGTRSVSPNILGGSHTEIEYSIGERMTNFLQRIRIFHPWRRVAPSGQVEESEDGSNLVSVIQVLEVQLSQEITWRIEKDSRHRGYRYAC